jgi:hypothetical protein
MHWYKTTAVTFVPQHFQNSPFPAVLDQVGVNFRWSGLIIKLVRRVSRAGRGGP